MSKQSNVASASTLKSSQEAVAAECAFDAFGESNHEQSGVRPAMPPQALAPSVQDLTLRSQSPRWWVAGAACVFVLSCCCAAVATAAGSFEVAYSSFGAAFLTGLALALADEMGLSS